MKRERYPINEVFGLDDAVYYLLVFLIVEVITYFSAREYVFSNDTEAEEGSEDKNEHELNRTDPVTGNSKESWEEKKEREEKENAKKYWWERK